MDLKTASGEQLAELILQESERLRQSEGNLIALRSELFRRKELNKEKDKQPGE